MFGRICKDLYTLSLDKDLQILSIKDLGKMQWSFHNGPKTYYLANFTKYVL